MIVNMDGVHATVGELASDTSGEGEAEKSLSVVFVVLVVIFHGVGNHISQYPGDMVVRCFVEHLLVASSSTHEAGGTQETKVMADERLRCAGGFGDVANRDWSLEAAQQNAQARGIAQELIGFGNQLNGVIFR